MTTTPLPAPGRRIAVAGTSGSGKTFVARALAGRLGLTYICNDSIIWGPNWTPTPRERKYPVFAAAFAGEAWTFDGNFGSLKDPEDRLLLQRIDTLIWLDLPRREVFPQLLRRTLRRVWTQEPLWHGNRETCRNCFLSRDSILWWSVKTYSPRKRQYSAIFADDSLTHVTKIHLRSRRELNQWLNKVT